MEICPVGAELFHAVRQTVPFRNWKKVKLCFTALGMQLFL